METSYLGIRFREAGRFSLSPHSFSYSQKGTRKTWKSPVVCNLIDDNDYYSGANAYLVTVGGENTSDSILYAGMYSTLLHQRWFQRGRHHGVPLCWHSDNLDNNIELLLRRLSGTIDEASWNRPSQKKSQKVEDALQKHFLLKARCTSNNSEDKAIKLWLACDRYIKTTEGVALLAAPSVELHFLNTANELILPFNSKSRFNMT